MRISDWSSDVCSSDLNSCRRRQLFERGLDRSRQAAQRLQLGLVRGEFGNGRQLAMHEQMRDFLELALRGDIENVVAAVVQVIAAAADRAQRGDRKSVV